MRLKRLQLQGFKTFAPKTELIFGEGLTAIVGPNGSGKSNVADAVRWALGEQSLSNLRAKKTEDLIFAGSSKRAPLGMAEVSLTIDNSDHLLPLDFNEVTLTRRAYRSGENEYYINKSRVRLRDVLDIASTLGQAYTVVGQGLVDAALSLRPEERRELFEEAAAIRGYFVQREDALRRLTRTEENVTRISDLAAELEPQVRRMERQARQAEEYGKLEAELHALLERWYASRWLTATTELRRAEAEEESARLLVEARKGEVAKVGAQLAEARARVWQLVDAVSALHEERAQAQARHAAQSQAQAVLAERLQASTTQRATLLREQADLNTAIDQTRSQVAALQEEAGSRQAEIALLESEGREVAQRIAELDRDIAAAQSRVRGEQSRIEALERKLVDLDNRLVEGQRQRAEQESAAAEGEAAIATLRSRLEAEEATLDERKAAVSQAQRGVAEAERALADQQVALRTARATRQSLEEKRRDLSRQADNNASHIAALAGEQQASLYGGVRAIVAAAREGKLEGYIGTVAELVRVPTHLEVAIEAALGGRLQEVVMQRWSEVERAIALLKQSGAGRATFLPLDTLRAPQVSTPPKGPGIVGLARDLVDYDAHLDTLTASLLGRLLIVEDLPSARKTISSLPANAPWTLATVGGEVVRPGGSVTGGANTRADDARAKGRTILGRERKRRELQGTQERLAGELKEADTALERAAVEVREADGEVARASGMLEESRKRLMSSQMAHMEQQGVLSRLQQEVHWRVGLVAETRKTLDTLANLETEVAARRAELESEVAPVREEAARAASRLEALNRERASIAAQMGTGETRIAVMSEGLRNVLSRRGDLQHDITRLEKRQADNETRLTGAVRDEKALAEQREQYAAEVAGLAARLSELEAQVAPSEHEVRRHEAEVSRIEAAQSGLQERLLESDTRYSRAAVEKQRCVGVLESLRIEVSEELGTARSEDEGEPAELAEVTQSAGVAAGGAVLSVSWTGEGDPPWIRWELAWSASTEGHSNGSEASHNGNGHHVPDISPDEDVDLERRVRALKARLSRLGPVNPLAMEEHAALSERHSFLQTQLTDLTQAAEALRKVIGELDRTMRDQFAATFVQVNEAFGHFFTQLFGGGSARLELTNPEDVGASGVELMAQPPGKRMQPLAALSGGERALTSAALLFALLKVRPVPFCVLDEVDAALDESNVTRFRAGLLELGEKTQFVVITHNRGTIEAANTLYGVSMAGDGTSQLLSLKVED